MLCLKRGWMGCTEPIIVKKRCHMATQTQTGPVLLFPLKVPKMVGRRIRSESHTAFPFPLPPRSKSRSSDLDMASPASQSNNSQGPVGSVAVGSVAVVDGGVREKCPAEYIEKYNEYQDDYVRRLKAKYFSKKAFNGVDIFDQEKSIENEVIKASRWPCTRSFIDPVLRAEDQNVLSSSVAETSTMSNRKNMRKS